MEAANESPPTATGAITAIKEYWAKTTSYILGLNSAISQSTFGRIFRLGGSGHPNEIRGANFATEVRAGLTTFATMAYIIAVNAAILAETGGTCVCERPLDNTGNCANQSEWNTCKNEVKLDLITATAALAGFSSILFGFLTNLPVALAPGMGLNAYFTYQVVGVRGEGPVPYGLALTAVFVEGWIFVFLALTGMRQWFVKVIPGSIKTASGVGIGLFLTLIGLSYNSGIGLVTGSIITPLSIAGCPPEFLSATGECNSGVMTNPKMWVGIACGGILTAALMAFRVKSAIVLGIAFVSALSWFRDTPITYFPYTAEGDSRFEYFKKVVSFHPIKHTLAVQQWDLSGSGGHFTLALFTFLYVDIIDCTATLYSMARFCNKTNNRNGDFPRSTIAYCTDAFCISIASLLGCSPVTAFVESGAGIAEGGCTGLTAIVTGLCFMLSLFFAPIFASIPPWATGCTLILVGCLMARQVTSINWAYIGDSVPAFVTLALIPFSYSVAYGLMAGLFTYTALNSLIRFITFCNRGRVEPRNYEMKEYWTWKPSGPRGQEHWSVRVLHAARFWRGGNDTTKSGSRTSADAEAGSEGRSSGSSLKGVALANIVRNPERTVGRDRPISHGEGPSAEIIGWRPPRTPTSPPHDTSHHSANPRLEHWNGTV